MTEETWEGDEYGDELPVAAMADEVSPRKRRWRPVVFEERQRGIPLPEVPAARQAALAEATGKGPPLDESWRQDLAGKKRNRASDALTSRKPTHNSGRGFGLAE